MGKAKAYRTFKSMHLRCYSEKDHRYHYYGGRGITVCDRWLNSFENFYEDMGDPPTPKHSIDRIDNDGNYCPENCRWATIEEQANNKRNNHILTYNGITQTISQWSKYTGIDKKLIASRIYNNWSVEQALTLPVGSKVCQDIRRHSEITKQKLSESKIGDKNPMYGKHGELHHFYGKKHSEISLSKMKRPVLQFSLDGELIREWNSATDASLEIGISRGNIPSCCNGKRKSAGGFVWKYKNEQ